MKLSELQSELGRLLYRDAFSQTNIIEIQNAGSDIFFLCDYSDLRADLEEARRNEDRLARELAEAENERDTAKLRLEEALACLNRERTSR